MFPSDTSISVCKRNGQILKIYRESEVYKDRQPVSNPYSCAMFLNKYNTLKTDNNNTTTNNKKQPTKKKKHCTRADCLMQRT